MSERLLIPLGPTLDDEDYMPSPQEPISIESELEQFRRQWQFELSRPDLPEENGNDGRRAQPEQNGNVSSAGHPTKTEPSLEEQAKFLFLQGVNAEQTGRLANAIQYYRRALQLVPDIESRIDDFQPPPRRERTESGGSNLSAFSDGGEEEEEEDDEDDLQDLVTHFTRLRLANRTRCIPLLPQRTTHISALPVELLVHIFKWVVSTELDVASLESAAMVCRSWFLCARDEGLWRRVCARVWGRQTDTAAAAYSGSFRQMFIRRPRMRTNGVYISRCHYYRQGEKGLDNLYKPFHFVEYFRYLRFFPDGQVLMLTTPDDPQITVGRLKSRAAAVPGILHGYYRLVHDTVTCLLKRRGDSSDTGGGGHHKYKRHRRPRPAEEKKEQTFHAEFTVRAAGGRGKSQLVWQRYSVHTVSGGEESASDFELSHTSHTPLFFSRVRSYTQVAHQPLV